MSYATPSNNESLRRALIPYGPLVGSSLMPLIDFCVKWGHLLIGLSLISSLTVRVSGVFGILLMLLLDRASRLPLCQFAAELPAR